MTITYGLTLEGLVIKTMPVIRAGIESRLRAKFSTSIDVSDESVEGYVAGIISEIAALLWELGEGINNSRSRDKAVGQQLEDIGLLTGSFREQASYSAVTLTLTGLPTSVVPAGSLAAVEGTERQFLTTEDKTIAALPAWAPLTSYAIADRVTNDGNAYVALVAGLSAASGGPSTQLAHLDPITDGAVQWGFLGTGAGAVDALARAVELGPVIAVSGGINSIVSHLGGWNGVINLLDATPGTNLMSDEQYRILQEIELAKPGTSPPDAIVADLRDVSGVTTVTVFTNPTDFTLDGIPPHSVEALVDGGADQDIWDQLLASVSGGIRTHGTEVGASVDAAGRSQVMKFSRATLVPIYVAITLKKVPSDPSNSLSYPADGDAQAKLAVATFGNLGGNGRNVVSSALQSALFGSAGVPGVTEVVSCFIGLSPAPASTTTIVITDRQRAVYDTSRVSISSSDGDF